MKKANVFLLLFTMLFLCAGCTTEDDYPDYDITGKQGVEAVFSLANNSGDKEKSFKTKGCSSVVLADNIGSVHVSSIEEEPWDERKFSNTKTSWGNSGGSVTWAAGDQVGIYMRHASGKRTTSNNVQHNITTGNTNSSSLTANSSKIFFPHPVAQNNVKFHAYYPYAGVSSATSPIQFANTAAMDSLIMSYSLPANQSSQTTLRNCDIMCATSSVTNGLSPNVTLAFNHKMVLLSFRITTTLSLRTLTKVTLSGSAVTGSGSLNLTNATLTPNSSVTFSPYVTTSQYAGLGNTAYVDMIINPCTISNNGLGSQLTVSMEFSGLLGSRTTNLITSGTFVGGTRYIYTINVVL